MADVKEVRRQGARAALQEARARLDFLASKNTGDVRIGILGAVSHLGVLEADIDAGRYLLDTKTEENTGEGEIGIKRRAGKKAHRSSP